MNNEAQIEMTSPKEGVLTFRLLRWVKQTEEIKINGKPPTQLPQDHIVRIPDSRKGRPTTISFPLEQKREREFTAGIGKEYDIFWIGNTVLEIHPAGKNAPIYGGQFRG